MVLVPVWFLSVPVWFLVPIRFFGPQRGTTEVEMNRIRRLRDKTIEGVLKDVFPRLYALERHQNVNIHTKLIDYSLVNSFRRNPRSGVEEFQLDNLSRLVSTITLSSAVDRYVWSLENSGEFSVKSIRQVIDANCFPVIHSATRWVKSVPLKVNIMAWKIKIVLLIVFLLFTRLLE
ncbi:hypothetical protein Tco_0947606 [Tanacetum coccineum]